MTLDAIRAAVEQHACHVSGIRYGFVLKWAAVERHVEPERARYLLNVELAATPGPNAPAPGLQMLVRIGELSELAPLLDDALYHHIADQLVVEGRDVTSTPHEIGRAAFPSAAVRPN
jgi:hypothetical protein